MSDQSTTVTAKHFLRPRLREGAFIGITAACVYLLLSLLSYTPDDPGWSATATTEYVSNAGGPTGAWLADVFFSLIGYLAYHIQIPNHPETPGLILDLRKTLDWLTVHDG